VMKSLGSIRTNRCGLLRVPLSILVFRATDRGIQPSQVGWPRISSRRLVQARPPQTVTGRRGNWAERRSGDGSRRCNSGGCCSVAASDPPSSEPRPWTEAPRYGKLLACHEPSEAVAWGQRLLGGELQTCPLLLCEPFELGVPQVGELTR
jgi:hypothetical protein